MWVTGTHWIFSFTEQIPIDRGETRSSRNSPINNLSQSRRSEIPNMDTMPSFTQFATIQPNTLESVEMKTINKDTSTRPKQIASDIRRVSSDGELETLIENEQDGGASHRRTLKKVSNINVDCKNGTWVWDGYRRSSVLYRSQDKHLLANVKTQYFNIVCLPLVSTFSRYCNI